MAVEYPYFTVIYVIIVLIYFFIIIKVFNDEQKK